MQISEDDTDKDEEAKGEKRKAESGEPQSSKKDKDDKKKDDKIKAKEKKGAQNTKDAKSSSKKEKKHPVRVNKDKTEKHARKKKEKAPAPLLITGPTLITECAETAAKDREPLFLQETDVSVYRQPWREGGAQGCVLFTLGNGTACLAAVLEELHLLAFAINSEHALLGAFFVDCAICDAMQKDCANNRLHDSILRRKVSRALKGKDVDESEDGEHRKSKKEKKDKKDGEKDKKDGKKDKKEARQSKSDDDDVDESAEERSSEESSSEDVSCLFRQLHSARGFAVPAGWRQRK